MKLTEKQIKTEMENINNRHYDLHGNHRRADELHELRMRAIENLKEKSETK